MDEEVPLLGGNVGTVVRVGNTVRRATGPWTAAVHELLGHLESVSFGYSPRVPGIDAQGREVLTFVEGDTVGVTHPWPAWAWSDDTVTQAGRILREYHDAVRDFRPSGPRTWRSAVGPVGADEVLCHNDVAPYNIVHRDGRIVAIIDWDFAKPARPVVDLAFSAWTFGPVHTAAHARLLDAPMDTGRRIRLLADAYGLDDAGRAGLLDVLATRMQASIDDIEAFATAGDEAFVRLVADGHVARMRDDQAWLAANHDGWRALLA